jgi:predicted lipoprotein with Yx(FWY)xxD motif
VTRTDLPGLGAMQQVTYGGMPLYRFFLDESSDEIEGANLFDPVTSPTGIWYLVGRIAAIRRRDRQLQLETAPVARGADATVLAATMNEEFNLFPNASFPVYTASQGQAAGLCQDLCAQYWPPVLTSGAPGAGSGVDQQALGTRKRPDGTQQVTYKGKPLYLFADDAYIPGLPYGSAGINGAGADTMWGVFNTIPPSN